MTAWITPGDVAALIGGSSQPTQSNVDQAAAIVEAFINREVEDIPNISARDLRRIQKAISWQSYFLADQPDFSYLTLIEASGADGQTFQMAKRGVDGSVFEAAQILHPLAIRELRNLSWKNGSIHPVAVSTLSAPFLNESYDDDHSWRELY